MVIASTVTSSQALSERLEDSGMGLECMRLLPFVRNVLLVHDVLPIRILSSCLTVILECYIVRIMYKRQAKSQDNLKKEWQIWDKLVGHETGLGWNYAKQTVDATPEWWDRKIQVSNAVKLSKQLDRICHAVESKAIVTRNNQAGSTIRDCIEMITVIPEVNRGGELFMLGMRLFVNQNNREMFVALNDPDLQLAWLKQEQFRETPIAPTV
ncbi:hypothetical protein L1049_002858 [Liquidambar formosana]|uniref:Myb/SANT-like domain-containing protein n=1 Tax=Liquidambar formosana TaxID=63359 RepID=A0AAP0NGK9_LIQFO